jgi:hypothetical protein
MSFSLLTAALVMPHARISALEAELKASREAWESAKVSAEKAAKSAENKAKKS